MGIYLSEQNFQQSPAFSGHDAFSVSKADYAVAAAQLCFIDHGDADPARISRCVSDAVGRPVLVVNLDYLPYGPKPGDNGILPAQQAQEHVRIFKDILKRTFPGQRKFPSRWNWDESGQICTVTSDSNRTDEAGCEDLPVRLTGKFWTSAAIITTPHRIENDRDAWSYIAGAPTAELQQVPPGDAIRSWSFGHEISHVIQLSPHEEITDKTWQFETELDSDRGSFAGLRILGDGALAARRDEFEETIRGVGHGRALSAFRALKPWYWSALRHDGDKDVSYEQIVLSTYETRLRVYAKMNQIELPASSEDIQHLIAGWNNGTTPADPLVVHLEKAFGDSFSWANYNSIDKSIPVLDAVLREGNMTDPRTIRTAELTLAAASYFRPSLKEVLNTQPIRGTAWMPGEKAQPLAAMELGA